MPGREEVGAVIQLGKNLGSAINVYAYVILIESAGEVCFYDSKRLTRCDEKGGLSALAAAEWQKKVLAEWRSC